MRLINTMQTQLLSWLSRLLNEPTVEIFSVCYMPKLKMLPSTDGPKAVGLRSGETYSVPVNVEGLFT